MNLLTKWQLGAKALAVCNAVGELVRNIDADAVLAIVLKIIELERELNQPGSGLLKFERLLVWFKATFPRYGDQVGALRQFTGVLVALLNAVKLFRK